MNQNKAQQVAESLIGLRLSVAGRAGDMRVLHFGQMQDKDGATVGQCALHIQCPWRIDGPDGIVTGRSDLWEPISGEPMPDEWEPGLDDNVQDVRIGNLLGRYDAKTHSHVNDSESLVVEHVRASNLGDLAINLSGGYRLVLFPGGSTGEAWRLFEPGKDAPHFVIEGNGSHFE